MRFVSSSSKAKRYLPLLLSNSRRSVSSYQQQHQQPGDLKWPTNKIRQTFIDYFCSASNRHKFIRSSSVLPQKGSGTYFTNAGMNQFKPIIMGEMSARDLLDETKYVGAANTQKCIRIGGKHNDLDDIGKDSYHHTFFEMLGNWSFGSYSTRRACEMALELLVDKYKLDMDRLYFTYFSGESSLGLPADSSTRDIWLSLGVPPSNLLPFDMKSNFWEMDVVGPCGPCTEIHYDRQPVISKKAPELVNAGTERVIELWNIVMMNYNRTDRRTFSRLPAPVIDTGMGLERMSAVLNNLDSNYDTDLFLPIFNSIHATCRDRATTPSYWNAKSDPRHESVLFAYRTIGDHMRSICVAISDGLLPSRNGLGGFLRFLILKCMKLSQETFVEDNESAEFLCRIVPIVVDSLKQAFPELQTKTAYIQQVIRNTELRHKEKLASSRVVIDRYLNKLGSPSALSAEQLWRLYKGDGTGEEIPIDFIQSQCQQKSVQLDLVNFDRMWLANQEKALANQKNTRKENSVYIELASEMMKSGVVKTDDSFKYEFDLIDESQQAKPKRQLESKILALAVKDSQTGKYVLRREAKQGDECLIVLDKSQFYPESGGQVSDRGRLLCHQLLVEIDQVNSVQGYSFHHGRVVVAADNNNNTINVNDSLTCHIDPSHRYSVSLNHTAVHLVNHSIRRHFNNESAILQAGSHVKPDSFKFEFKFNGILLDKLSGNDLKQLESLCNELIQKNLDVVVNENVYLDDTQSDSIVRPVRRLQDILYPVRVRVVSLGAGWKSFSNAAEVGNNDDVSAELCCGTHASNTGQLGGLCITNFHVVGDSTFEIEGQIGSRAAETQQRDAKLLDYLQEMINLHESVSNLDENPTLFHQRLTQIARVSIQVEEMIKKSTISYLVSNRVKEESVKYRPSKNKLQNALKRVLDNNQDDREIVEIESVLMPEQIVNAVLSKLTTTDNKRPVWAIVNVYRRQIVLYSKTGDQKELNKYQELLQTKTRNQLKLVTSGNKNFQVLGYESDSVLNLLK